ncbi:MULTISPECIES: DUF6660 family protein [unclassified Arcicella]|uniref:DUF6660 family protein n=1 Tax=unclassified Arcicella TaxID=2644986 RepID=UPI00286C8B20|nr:MULTISPECIES: DUF6660 family protein [unclassified Arcicella]
MKIYSVILSMYILVLACLPCGDVNDCNKVSGDTHYSLSKTNHTEHTEDTETCSPFCTCACCGMNIAFRFYLPTLTIENESSFYTGKTIIVYKNESPLSNFYGNIWQPPKV